LKAVLREHAGAVLLATLLTWLLTAAVVVTLLMMPTLLQTMGVDRGAALSGNTLAICATILANLVAGWLADRLAGTPATDRFLHVDSIGRVTELEPPWRTGAPAATGA
jgi:hypothetical protein